jgi:hypothetical protein
MNEELTNEIRALLDEVLAYQGNIEMLESSKARAKKIRKMMVEQESK